MGGSGHDGRGAAQSHQTRGFLPVPRAAPSRPDRGLRLRADCGEQRPIFTFRNSTKSSLIQLLKSIKLFDSTDTTQRILDDIKTYRRTFATVTFVGLPSNRTQSGFVIIIK